MGYPPYTLRLFGVACFGAAGTAKLLAAFCRWQARKVARGRVRQPGVSLALVLGSGCALSAVPVLFLLAHLDSSGLVEALDALESGLQTTKQRGEEHMGKTSTVMMEFDRRPGHV